VDNDAFMLFCVKRPAKQRRAFLFISKDEKTKRQKDEKTKRRKDEKTKDERLKSPGLLLSFLPIANSQ